MDKNPKSDGVQSHPAWSALYKGIVAANNLRGYTTPLDEKGNFIQTRCPGHDDTNPSLWVGVNEEGGLWIKCKAGRCDQGHILDRVGLQKSDLGSRGAGKKVAEYVYRDLDGLEQYRKVRYEPKGFCFFHKDSLTGAMKKGRGAERILYRVEDIAEARESGQELWITEGEKDADIARLSYGKLAITNDDGADGWKDTDTGCLHSIRRVVLVVDRDPAGAKRLKRLWSSINGVYGTSCLIRMLNIPEGYNDLGDLRDAGFTKEQIEELVSDEGITEKSVEGFTRDANDKLMSLIENYAYALVDKRYIELKTKRLLDQEMFCNEHAVDFDLTGRGSSHAMFQRHPKSKKVDVVTYMPGADLFIKDPVGKSAVNYYRSSDMEIKEGPMDKWFELAEHVIEDHKERELYYDWQAHMLQKPGVKCNWMVFMGSQWEGIGKDSLLIPIIRALGQHNTSVVSPRDIASGRNWYLEQSKLVVISEVESNEKKQVAEALTSALANFPEVLPLDIKYRPHAQVPNIANYIGFSNKRDALWLKKFDRRFFVVWSDAKPKPEQFYKEYHQQINDHPGAVAHWLMNRDIRHFNPKAPAMMTKAKEEMIAVTNFGVTGAMAEMIEDGLNPFDQTLFTIDQVQTALENSPVDHKRMSKKALGIRLRELGAHCLGQVLIYPVESVDGHVIQYKNVELLSQVIGPKAAMQTGFFKKVTLFTMDEGWVGAGDGGLREQYLVDLKRKAGTVALEMLMRSAAKEEVSDLL